MAKSSHWIQPDFDAIIFGYYESGKLMYAGRTRNGFTPASREKLFRGFKAWRRRGARAPICLN